MEPAQTESELSNFQILPSMVEKKLKNLKIDKAAGPDGLPPRLYKELATELSVPLAKIFNMSLKEGRIPSAWKIAHVVPIYKKGKKSQPGNYRPVSLTNVACKVMESLIREQMLEHLQVNKLFSQHQHGFVSGRSCSTNLLASLEYWTALLEENCHVDSIYLDFAKAFDTVPHERLLIKLRSYGITGNVHQWIQSFLENRKQCVVLEGVKSGWEKVLSGIPQGSVLGPVLFICYVNDLPDYVKSKVFLFADDTKLCNKVPDPDNTLQKDLDSLQVWSDKWQLRFNATKCKVMHLGNQQDPVTYYMQSSETAVELEEISIEKDLGVNVDRDLNFTEHVHAQTVKANRLLCLIRRSFTYLDEESLPLLYMSIVRPHLEYGNVAWCPKFKKETDMLEGVQRRATRMIPSLKGKTYEERLQILKLPSLYYRRARGDMIECYKYLTGIYQVDNSFLELDKSATRGHMYKLKKLAAQKSCRAKFFSRRVTNAWNRLPDHVVQAPTLNSFKNRLDKVWACYRFSLNSDWF